MIIFFFLISISKIKERSLNVKRDIYQQDVKNVDLHFVKSE